MSYLRRTIAPSGIDAEMRSLQVRDREGAIASTQGACAPQNQSN
jgi:hypothetical protein